MTHFAVSVSHFVEVYVHFVDSVTNFVVSDQQRGNVHFPNAMWRPPHPHTLFSRGALSFRKKCVGGAVTKKWWAVGGALKSVGAFLVPPTLWGAGSALT